ncbi:uncharacterized protein LOC110901355 [Helianthus annuus]|uniref:uncharacterized protein LOC110901355 n=1 Tax=Helianthus annuus TaxID=4232 RepID=UPI001652FF8B|nr:uncharacterized protein LOC110901355 [Helianthus annuus]
MGGQARNDQNPNQDLETELGNRRAEGMIGEIESEVQETTRFGDCLGVQLEVWIRNLKREVKFNFLGLQETHQADLSKDPLSRFWDRSPMECSTVDALGRSGGIPSLWDPGIFTADTFMKDQWFLLVSGYMRGMEDRVNVINIHAPNDLPSKRLLWDSIIEIKAQHLGLWVALGDFNDGRVSEYQMIGGKFTYISDNSVIKFSKLDRFFVCEQFLNIWPFAPLKVLRRGWSDHCPVILACGAQDFGPVPFKFYNSWIGSKELDDIVKKNVVQQATLQKGDIVLAKTLKSIKSDIKSWRVVTHRQEMQVMEDLGREAERLEKLAETTSLNAEEKQLRAEIRVQLKRMEIAKIKDLYQKSRVKWIKDGDENTKFFHGVINTNISRSRINGIVINGVWVTDPIIIKEHICKWFKKQFSEPIRRRSCFSNLGLPSLSQVQAENLVVDFTVDEIKEAIKN